MQGFGLSASFARRNPSNEPAMNGTPSCEPQAIRNFSARAVMVPLTFALGTSAAVIKSVPLLLLDVQMQSGVTGRSYIFCYSRAGAKGVAAVLADAFDLVKDQAADPQSVSRFLARRFDLLGVTGITRMALSALDMALWDACAVAANLPMVTFLGGRSRPIRAYDSRGLGLMEAGRLADEAEALLAKGLKAVKLRLGYPTLAEDVNAVKAVRRRIPGSIAVMVDFNQALTTTEAITRGLALQGEGIAWLEEPIRHDDYAGNAAIADALDVPLQIGENFNGPAAMLDAVTMRAADLVMPDVARIGGVTGWQQAAGIAAAAGLQISSHLMPEPSVHLLAASPSAHWIEYVDWADAVLEQPLAITDGEIAPPMRPGFGLLWDEAKLKRLEPV